MLVKIEYCRVWNYEPHAAGLAARIRERHDCDVELVPASGGVFEVTVDGELIFSKQALGRFPEDAEILGPLAKREERS